MTQRRKSILWAITISLPIVVTLVGIEIAGSWSLPHWRFPFDNERIAAYDPEIGYVERPHLRVKWGEYISGTPLGYHIYSDRRGTRVSNPGEETPAHADVLFVGCSFTWGAGVEYQDTFAARLEKTLGVPTANMALFAYGTTQALQMLRRYGDMTPKLVIYPFINDHLRRNIASCAPSFYPFCLDVSHVSWRSGRAEIAPPNSNGVKRIDLQVRSQTHWLDPITWVTHRLNVIYGRVNWAWSRSIEANKEQQDAALEFLLTEMARSVDDIGAKLLVVYLPVTSNESPPDVLERSLARLRIPLLDLSAPFREYTSGGQKPELYLPDFHPSAIGHALVAERLASFIEHEKLLVRK
jgi:hypothetical protein